MKKLSWLLCGPITTLLTSCNYKTPEFESHIYCTLGPCVGCEEWTAEVDISTAYSISCTDLTTDSHYRHYHYCVTYVK